MGEKGVYLGRFCPFHKGHEMILKTLTKKYGESRVVVLIGSPNFLSERTPYTFELRKRMIRTVFPKLKIIPLPDTTKKPKYLGDPYNTKWLNRISKIEKSLKSKFVFYGGSKTDLEILALRFKTKVLLDRNKKGKGISGTLVRGAIKKGDFKTVKKMVNPKIFELVLKPYTK